MKRLTFFILTLLFFTFHVDAQFRIPLNSTIESDLERQALNTVSANTYISPFMIQLSVNFGNEFAPADAEEEFEEYVALLARKRERGISDEDFLRHLYYRTHKRYLKNYRAYSSFAQLMHTGSYDCLSATILYTLLLERFNIAYDIIETESHIYLMAGNGSKRFLLESTDPLNGFVTEERIISERIEEIKNRNDYKAERYLTFQPAERRFNDIMILAGLQYYNASVKALREQNLPDAIDQLEKARFYDDSDRFMAYGKFLARILVRSDIPAETRQLYLLKLTRFLNDGMITASL